MCFLLLLLLLASSGRLAAQDSASRLIPASTDDLWPAPSEIASSTDASPVYRLLPRDAGDPEPWMASANLETGPPLALGPDAQSGMPFGPADTVSVWPTQPPSWRVACPTDQTLSDSSIACDPRMASAALTMDAAAELEIAEPELPRSEWLERNRRWVSIALPIATVALVSVDALLPYSRDPFRVDHEGWFGRDTDNGGADKASHFVDYYIIAGLYEDIYRMMGWSEKEAILWGFGVAVATGIATEINNGFSKEYGYSWEDLTMDVAGATASSVLSLTHTRDLFGFRTSHLPHDTYTHDVYSADFKISGLEKRLGLNLGPLRWLLFSVTYGAKGYQVSPPTTLQRQVGFEIGLNFQQILNDLGVRKSSWWGYALHLVADNVRFPFTAVGMRYDLNSGKWHGPNSGNYD